jgi:hypothetical protein
VGRLYLEDVWKRNRGVGLTCQVDARIQLQSNN